MTLTSEYRLILPRATYLAARARNAMNRPIFIGAVSVGTFVTALVAGYLVVQIAIPLVQCLTPHVQMARFGWQMFALLPAPRNFRVVLADGRVLAVDGREALSHRRIDLNLERDYPPYLCQAVPGAQRVVFRKMSDGRAEEYPCHP